MKLIPFILISFITTITACKSNCDDKYEPQFAIVDQSHSNILDRIYCLSPRNIEVWTSEHYSIYGPSKFDDPIPFYGSGNEMKFSCYFRNYPSDSILSDTFTLKYKSKIYFISNECGYGYKISDVQLIQNTFHAADSIKFNSETMKLSIWD